MDCYRSGRFAIEGCRSVIMQPNRCVELGRVVMVLVVVLMGSVVFGVD